MIPVATPIPALPDICVKRIVAIAVAKTFTKLLPSKITTSIFCGLFFSAAIKRAPLTLSAFKVSTLAGVIENKAVSEPENNADSITNATSDTVINILLGSSINNFVYKYKLNYIKYFAKGKNNYYY